MISVAVSGYGGRMGSAVVDAVTAADDMEVVAGIDPRVTAEAFPPFLLLKTLLPHSLLMS